jgi:hypothetical protein
LKTFIEPDARWETMTQTSKWGAFRRLSEGPLGEQWFDQPFFPAPPLGVMRRTKNLVPLTIKKRLKGFM